MLETQGRFQKKLSDNKVKSINQLQVQHGTQTAVK